LIGDAIQENVEDVFMEDVDGSGFSLTIPALLIEKAAAEAIIAHADDKFSVIKLQASLSIVKTEKKVAEVSLWYGST
jgi:hypothetical protein